ncbi:RICIN domain-containing protein [Pseudoalteromonas sp. JBTF-M23]|uniref:RICIN domain-containing protein n=1 Tax=Pseudoalteromonas caenipelagi TaxID=2726988 RepID=A0A849VG72_9GAMM|nr:RICIN domain-containing protein [Pseudoalteromonas caenipelagi]NOU50711.1 RICIN domain-containing protein [Pseudoalteromonas caenipelagi]
MNIFRRQSATNIANLFGMCSTFTLLVIAGNTWAQSDSENVKLNPGQPNLNNEFYAAADRKYGPDDNAAGKFAHYTMASEGTRWHGETIDKDGHYFRLNTNGGEALKFRFKRVPRSKYYYIQHSETQEMLKVSGGSYPGTGMCNHYDGYCYFVHDEYEHIVKSSDINKHYSQWEVNQLGDSGVYTIKNRQTNLFLIAADIDGSKYDVRLGRLGSFNAPSAPPEAKWKLEEKIPGEIKLGNDFTVEYYNVKYDKPILNESHIKSEVAAVISNETDSGGTYVTGISFSESDSSTAEISQSKSSSITHDHAITVAIEWTSNAILAKSKKSLSTTHSISRTTSSSQTIGNSKTLSKGFTITDQVRHNYGAEANLNAKFIYKYDKTSVPMTATVVKKYNDGYVEIFEDISTTIENVTYSDFSAIVYDSNASVYSPRHLEIKDALKRNNVADIPTDYAGKRAKLISFLKLHSNDNDLNTASDRELILRAFIHLRGRKAGLFTEDNAKFFTTQEKLDDIVKYISLRSSEKSLAQYYDAKNSEYRTYQLLQSLVELTSDTRYQANVFYFNDKLVDIFDVLAYLDWVPLNELVSYTHAQAKNALISGLVRVSTTSENELFNAEEQKLITYAMVYKATKSLTNNQYFFVNQHSLDDQRNHYIATRHNIDNSDVPTMQSKSSYQLMQEFFMDGTYATGKKIPEPNQNYVLRSKASNKVITSLPETNSKWVVFNDYRDDTKQQWQLILTPKQKDQTEYSFISDFDGHAMQLKDNSRGLVTGEYQNQIRQKWLLEHFGGNYYRIKASQNDHCLTVLVRDQYKRIEQRQCKGSNADNQMFKLEALN